MINQMSRGDVLGRLVCLRLVIDTDAFLFLAVCFVVAERLVADADAFLFLPECAFGWSPGAS